MFTTTSKSEDDYYDGPPPPDKIQSNKPKLPSNRITPVKAKTNKVDADPLPDSVQTFQTLASTSGSINLNHIDTQTKVATASSYQHTHNANNAQIGSEKSFFVSKIIRQKDIETKKRDLTLKVNSLATYTTVKDDPRRQQITSELLQSDILFLEIKEIKDDDVEPRYVVFGEGEPLCKDHADISAE